jgi:hypothetical protein
MGFCAGVHLQTLFSGLSIISITTAQIHGLRCAATSSHTDLEASQQVSLLQQERKLQSSGEKKSGY